MRLFVSFSDRMAQSYWYLCYRVLSSSSSFSSSLPFSPCVTKYSYWRMCVRLFEWRVYGIHFFIQQNKWKGFKWNSKLHNSHLSITSSPSHSFFLFSFFPHLCAIPVSLSLSPTLLSSRVTEEKKTKRITLVYLFSTMLLLLFRLWIRQKLRVLFHSNFVLYYIFSLISHSLV